MADVTLRFATTLLSLLVPFVLTLTVIWGGVLWARCNGLERTKVSTEVYAADWKRLDERFDRLHADIIDVKNIVLANGETGG